MNKIKVLRKTIWILLTDRELAASFFRNAFSLVILRLKFLFSKQKVIVIALIEHLGDIVAAEPVAQYLKSKIPGSFIAWVTDKKYTELISSNPNIDKAITVSCFTEWILLKHFLRKKNIYDLHINNKICERHHFIQIKENPYNITFENYYEKGNLLFAFSRSSGLAMPPDSPPHLFLKSLNTDQHVPSNSIVMHTSSNNQDRMWNQECWNKLAAFVLERFSQYPVIEIGYERKIILQDQRIIDMTGEKPLPVISDLINKSRLFIGIDSSFAHFANALNKDSVILIGAWGNFKNYMPYSGKFQIEKNDIIYYYSGPLQKMPCDDILNFVSKKLNS